MNSACFPELRPSLTCRRRGFPPERAAPGGDTLSGGKKRRCAGGPSVCHRPCCRRDCPGKASLGCGPASRQRAGLFGVRFLPQLPKDNLAHLRQHESCRLCSFSVVSFPINLLCCMGLLFYKLTFCICIRIPVIFMLFPQHQLQRLILLRSSKVII